MGKFSEAFMSANVVLTGFCFISCLYLLLKYGKRELYTFLTLFFLALTNLCKKYTIFNLKCVSSCPFFLCFSPLHTLTTKLIWLSCGGNSCTLKYPIIAFSLCKSLFSFSCKFYTIMINIATKHIWRCKRQILNIWSHW